MRENQIGVFMSNLRQLKKKKKTKRKWHEPEDEKAKALQTALLEVVDNQLRDKSPEETSKTMERLVAEGYSEIEAKKLIACVVSSEIFDILKVKRVYDHDKYISALRKLPRLPWE